MVKIPMNEKAQVPSWMLQTEDYHPESDHDGFITRSVLTMLSLLSDIRDNPRPGQRGPSAAMKMIMTLLLIILSAVSRNMMFTYILLAIFLLRLILLPGKALLKVVKDAFAIAILTALILLPSVFMGTPRTMITVSIKVFLSVGLIRLMSVTTPWNQITQSLKLLHLPDLLIFIFDLTLKYIAVLGDLCYWLLISLKLRSVGRNKHKGKAFSGILGVTFLKSRAMADEMYEAMVCRGFEGDYILRKKVPFRKIDIPFAIALLGVLLLFIYLQSAVL